MAKEYEQEFTEYIVRAIVNHPDEVSTERTVDERGVLITLHINSEDMGYVVGREGQTARAIRTLLKKIGARQNSRINLKIYEPEGMRERHYSQKAAQSGTPVATNVKTNSSNDDSSVDDLTF